MRRKGQIKISNFIISMIVGSLALVFFSLFMSNVSNSYNINYDNTTLQSYNQLELLSNITEDVKEKEESIEQNTDITDILGGLFDNAYQALRVTKGSYNAYETMAEEGIDNLNLGASGRYLKVALTSIVIVLIFIGVLLSAVVKRDL